MNARIGRSRRPTGYILFIRDMRAPIKEFLIESGNKPTPLEIRKELASRWVAMSDEQKHEWNKLAKEIYTESTDDDLI